MRGRRVARGMGMLVAGALVLGACRRGGSEPPRPPSPATDADADARQPDASSPRASGPTFRPWIDDPRLVEAKTALRGRDVRRAALLVDELAAKAGLPQAEMCLFSYVSGRLFAQSSEPARALAAFTRASVEGCVVGPYARLGAARAALLTQAPGEAEKLLAAVTGTAADDEARVLRADALALLGRRVEAVPLWRAVLDAAPRGPHWVECAGRLASALADGEAGAPPTDTAAKEAYRLATRVLLEAPSRADTYGAKASRARAAQVAKLASELTREERLVEARALVDGGDASRALTHAQALAAEPGLDPKLACGASLVRAQAIAKTSKSAPSADAWGDAIGKCDADPELVTALYSGAKSSASAKRPQEALFRFSEVERRFPTHRFADDAAVRAAAVLEDQGDRARAIDKLAQVADLYPEGDMRGEALFRAALLAQKDGDTARAAALLTRVDALFPDDRHWASAGRATFFRARLAERAGDTKGARALDGDVIARAPLSFYMARSYARLAEADPVAAKASLDALVARDAKSEVPAPSPEVLASAPWKRAQALLEAQDVDGAKRELVLAGALSEGASPELVWASGALFVKARAWDVGHSFSRGRVKDHLARLPEGGFRTLWETAYPRAFDDEVARSTAAHGVMPALVFGIMREESSFMPEVRSPANAYGLMQLIPPTAKWVSDGVAVSEADLKKPEVSVELGTKLLGKLLGTHKHPALAIAAYNAGSGAVHRWVAANGAEELEPFVEGIPYEETRNYVKRVLASTVTYAYLYDRGHLDELLRLPSKVTR